MMGRHEVTASNDAGLVPLAPVPETPFAGAEHVISITVEDVRQVEQDHAAGRGWFSSLVAMLRRKGIDTRDDAQMVCAVAAYHHARQEAGLPGVADLPELDRRAVGVIQNADDALEVV